MAGRLQKVGLDFFPLHVDVWNDDKIRFIGARFEEKGELIFIKLLQEIYKHKGYYMNWNDDEATLFAKAAGNNITPGLVKEVVNELLKRGFFSGALHMRFSILTSYNIQQKYDGICKESRRKGTFGNDVFINPDHKIIPYKETGKQFPVVKTALTQEEIELTPEEMQQRKEKERKGKKTNPADARAREFQKNILEDEFFIETACLNNKILKEEFPGAAADFFSTKISIGEHEEWENENDAKRNLMYWLKSYNERKQNSNYGKGKRNDKTERQLADGIAYSKEGFGNL